MKDIIKSKLKDGKFGNIYKSFDNELNKLVMIKEIKISNDKKLSLIEKDIEKMKQINSKYSIKLLKNYKENNYYFLVFDFFEDNLENYMKKNKLNDNQITKFLFQFNNFLLEIAIKNIIYQNIKPKNILIKFKNDNDKNDFDIKIANYGPNIKIDDPDKNDEFIAPEIFKNSINNKSDLFSIGKLLYFLFNNNLPKKNSLIECDNKDLENLINNLIINDYNKRLFWNQYFEHPFFIPYYINFLKENMTDFNHDNQTHDIIFSNLKFKNNIYKYLGETLKETKTFDGKGILFDEEGDKKYEGDFKNNKFNGKGILYYKNGNKRYDGLWKNNICDGEGTLFNINGTKKHEGLIKNGVVEGKGIIYYDNGKIKYEGDIKDDKSNGKGKEYYENGNLKYEGDFLNNKWNGKGVYYNENNNKIYEGEIKDNKPNNKGTYYYSNGNKKYEGNYKNGKPEGEGVKYYENEIKMYEGNWKEGKYNGKGKSYYQNGNIQYDGEWKDNFANGDGTSYYEDENEKEYKKGKFKNGNFVKENKKK